MHILLHKLSQIGLLNEDDALMVNRKRFVVYEAFLMSLGGILWGTICLIIEKPEQSITPFGYVFLSVLNIYTFSQLKNFSFAQGFQTGISLLLPFLFQWHLGGFYASGGVMIWSLLSLAASLSYSNARTSVQWLIVYVILVLLSGVFDQYFQSIFNSNYDIHFSIGLITMNIAVVSVLIFLLVIFYVRENANSLEQVRKAQELLIHSEKLAALGQLSAGIAHEINTPLGAIKAIASESGTLSRDLLGLFHTLCHRLKKEQIDVLIAYITSYEPREIYLSTSEERRIRKSLENELKERSIENSRVLAERLIQIDIHAFPIEIEGLIKQHPEEVIEFLNRLLLIQKNNASIVTAVDKASRIVIALKMYLHSPNKERMDFFNLHQSIENVLTIYSNQLKHGVKVEFNIPTHIEVFGLEEQINQVWTNIIVNACQAMKFNGTLTISCQDHKDKLCISISDTGEGIPSEIGDKVFEAFFSTKKIGEGSGLGLDIVKKIIEHHQGNLSYESQLGIGTTFYIELPKKIRLKSPTHE